VAKHSDIKSAHQSDDCTTNGDTVAATPPHPPARRSRGAARFATAAITGMLAAGIAGPVRADDAAASPAPLLFDSGKLLATSGVSNIEGAGGGGIATWALITGYGTRDAIGGNVHATYTGLSNFNAYSGGAALGLYDRVELSYNHIDFDTGNTGAKLGLGRGFAFHEDVAGLKVKLFGDAVYDQDSFIPQVAIGAQFKTTDHGALLRAVGARSNSGVDFYVAATKVFLDNNLLANVTVRMTKANQIGLLGFGGPLDDSYRPQVEASLAYLISKRFVVGAEYRTMPSNLGFTGASDWKDIFAAYFLTKNVSLTAAYVDLGTIATFKEQRGVYLSAQVGF